MGTFFYATDGYGIPVDDRTLRHLQLVITTKLRRGERFVLHLEAGGAAGACEVCWISPEIPLRFTYSSWSDDDINPDWLALLAEQAHTAAGLRVLPEPARAERAAKRR